MGAYCNFMHIKHIPRAIKRRVVREMYDDHPEYLGQTRGGRKDKEKKKRSRSRSRRRGDKERKEKDRGDRGEDAPPARQTSEERRAMIAQWNKDREGGDVVA